MITVEVWSKGYADESGLTHVKLPANSTEADIQAAVRAVGRYAILSGVRRPHHTGLTPSQIISYVNAFKNDNS